METSGYRFSKSHEWISVDGDVARLGITDYAQGQLGDVIYVELPKPGAEISAGGKFGVIESVKAASDLYSPVSGTVKQANPALTETPEMVNSDPHGAGWMLEIQLSEQPSSELMDEAGYRAYTEGL